MKKNRIKENFKKNFSSGIITLAILGIFLALFKFGVNQLKSEWDNIYHLLPWQIKNQYLEFIVFVVSTLIIIWIIGIIVNLEYKGKSIVALLNIIFSHMPVINSLFKFLSEVKKSVTGFLKYKMIIYWEVPVINILVYGVITSKVKIVKKFGNKKKEQNRFTIFFPSTPAILTGPFGQPGPKDIWLITNLTFIQFSRFIVTAGADIPDTIDSMPLLEKYPDCQIEIENGNQATKKEPK